MEEKEKQKEQPQKVSEKPVEEKKKSSWEWLYIALFSSVLSFLFTIIGIRLYYTYRIEPHMVIYTVDASEIMSYGFQHYKNDTNQFKTYLVNAQNYINNIEGIVVNKGAVLHCPNNLCEDITNNVIKYAKKGD